MTAVRFDIVDVFAERKYAGNQLAVVRDAAGLTDAEMLSLARETDFSETTFVVDEEPTVRIFTPREEIPFAGHPTLGTAAVLMAERGVAEITLRLKVGPIRVTRAGAAGDSRGRGRSPQDPSSELYWMKQNAATFGRATHDAREMAAILGLAPGDVRGGPIEDVSTGLLHTIVPLASRDAVARCRVDLPRYWKWTEGSASKSIAVFSHEGGRVAMRVFPIYYGIAEDPATGSAAGCLAGYLAKHATLGSGPVDARIDQGAEVGRPSVLHIRARAGEGPDVGGAVQRVVEGRLA
jgi:trans-2,3-dihydro-3-hydroxyanthranilate isomerase